MYRHTSRSSARTPNIVVTRKRHRIPPSATSPRLRSPGKVINIRNDLWARRTRTSVRRKPKRNGIELKKTNYNVTLNNKTIKIKTKKASNFYCFYYTITAAVKSRGHPLYINLFTFYFEFNSKLTFCRRSQEMKVATTSFDLWATILKNIKQTSLFWKERV